MVSKFKCFKICLYCMVLIMILTSMETVANAFVGESKPIFSILEYVREYGKGTNGAATVSAGQPEVNMDAEISLKVDKPSVLPGDKLKYMITVENKGDALSGVGIGLAVSPNMLPVEGANQDWIYVSMEEQEGEIYAYAIDAIDAGTPEEPTVVRVEFVSEVDKNLPSGVKELNASAAIAVESEEAPLATDDVVTRVINPASSLPNTGGLGETEVLLMVVALAIFLAGAVVRLRFKNRRQLQ